jgi:DNA excision repair protein ERCC-3
VYNVLRFFFFNFNDFRKINFKKVWCPMTAEFFDYYLKSAINRKLLLAVMNPNKFRVCQYLIRFHERRNDKVIFFF